MAEEQSSGGGIPEWVVTFGDMMSLLLTFFIMLVSLSEMKQEEKFQAMMESIRAQLGHTSSMAAISPGPIRPRNSSFNSIANMGRSKRLDLMKGGAPVKAPTGESRTVRIIRSGDRTVRGGAIPFPEASAELTPEAAQALRDLAPDFVGKPQLIEVLGHTSRRPLDQTSGFQDHWDLSAARSRAVMRFLIDEAGVEPIRLRPKQAGPYEPRYSGTDPLRMRENDRVEVFLLDQTINGVSGEPMP